MTKIFKILLFFLEILHFTLKTRIFEGWKYKLKNVIVRLERYYSNYFLFFFLFGSCFSLWDQSKYLSGNLGNFCLYLVQNRVDLSLVIQVDLWDWKEADPGHDYECHCVKPAANICQYPKRESKFDGVHHVFNEEKATKFQDRAVQLSCCLVGDFVYSLWRNGDIHSSVFCNGIGRFFLEECNHDVSVQFKSWYTHQDEQRRVCTYTDERVIADGNQSGHDGAKHDPSKDGIHPMIGAFKAHYELYESHVYGFLDNCDDKEWNQNLARYFRTFKQKV